tara:strand:+ start:45 stop:209 length:165 start_codon:yes stop_codon:yes gene_type:complete
MEIDNSIIFNELSDSIGNIIGYTFKESTEEETNKLERLQSELTELIAEIKIKNL